MYLKLANLIIRKKHLEEKAIDALIDPVGKFISFATEANINSNSYRGVFLTNTFQLNSICLKKFQIRLIQNFLAADSLSSDKLIVLTDKANMKY
ncbi:hypothetical protein BpHYR1_051446 [Brachionus plicatilis]|uniref:Uncharacterized protein n=1 Tax=Brachionus plicatilis TaxID=10195 RepID=A0A3M7RFC8_BRAPC|nr:hypothetical protein BpHYR1_051446 [Brachionus plicatilis]